MAPLLLLLACTSPDPGDSGGLATPTWDERTWVAPAPADLPEQVEPPDPFVSFFDGIRIDTPELWRDLRQRELALLFGTYAYGHWPAVRNTNTTVVATHQAVLDGAADLDLLEIEIVGVGTFPLLLVRPAGELDAPVVLGLDKCGDSSVIDDARVPLPTGHVPDDCPSERGGRASYWDLEGMVGAGWAVATVHASVFAADDADRFPDGLAATVGADEDAPWGALGAWAWGLEHAVAGLRDSDRVDPGDITLFGHSRRGKAALWATANGGLASGVWAHQSGTLGATLSRSDNGESVAAITTLFPHWFTALLDEFADRETHLPFDQHLLLGMCAPRSVLVTDGDDDTWADPQGAAESVDLARPVFTLLDADADALQHRTRPGGHEVTAEDWALFRASRD